MKKVLLFCDNDSQALAILPLAKHFLERHWEIIIVIPNVNQLPSHIKIELEEKFDLVEISIEKLIFSTLIFKVNAIGIYTTGSKLTRFREELELITIVEKIKNRPILFTGYNGLVYEKFEEGLSWRLGYDIIALNGPRDEELFRLFTQNGSFSNQKIALTGLANAVSAQNNRKFSKSNKRKVFVFAEQVIVPQSLQERRNLIKKLIRLAEQNPNWDIHIKARVQPNEKTFHKIKHHVSEIFHEFKSLPSNIEITYGSIIDSLKVADLFATISSTAIFEAIKLGIPTIQLADFGIKNSYGTHIFINSGLMVNFSELDDLDNFKANKPDIEWLRWLGAVNLGPENLITELEKKVNTPSTNFAPQLRKFSYFEDISSVNLINTNKKISNIINNKNFNNLLLSFHKKEYIKTKKYINIINKNNLSTKEHHKYIYNIEKIIKNEESLKITLKCLYLFLKKNLFPKNKK